MHEDFTRIELNSEWIEVRYRLEQYGGGRGLFAKQAITAGTVVLREEPILLAPQAIQEDDANMHAAIARMILQHPNRVALLQHCNHLCPVTLSELPPATLALLQRAHVSTLETLKEVEGEAPPAVEPLDESALMRLLVAMQMNAFRSGVYIRLALVNHSCRPNCTKFTPHNAIHSELAATRDIASGEELFVNYIEPFGQSLRRSKAAFEEQHMWTLPPEAMPFGPEVDALAEACAGVGQEGHEKVLEAVEELEVELDDIESAQQQQEESSSGGESVGRCSAALETAKSLLGPRHLVQLRARRLLVDALRGEAVSGGASDESCLLLVKSCRELLLLQEELQGPQHCDVAATLDVLQQTMEYLMARDSKALCAAFPEEWPTFAKVSKAQYALLRRFKAISALYAKGQRDGA